MTRDLTWLPALPELQPSASSLSALVYIKLDCITYFVRLYQVTSLVYFDLLWFRTLTYIIFLLLSGSHTYFLSSDDIALY